MEEQVGKYWDSWISRMADPHKHHQAVTLESLRKPLSVFFRTLGGDGGLNLRASTMSSVNLRRSWVQKLAGSGSRVALAWRDPETLHLPERINLFADAELNRELYYWLAALATAPEFSQHNWIKRSQLQVLYVLDHYPGLNRRYQTLSRALIRQRPDPELLPVAEAVQEQRIQQALIEPGSIDTIGECRYEPAPVLLWLHPSPPQSLPGKQIKVDSVQQQNSDGESKASEQQRKRKAKRKKSETNKGGLLALRYETSLFSIAEMANLDRSEDEDEDLQDAEKNADELEELTVSRDSNAIAKRIRFDLDLPSEAEDDLVIGTDHPLPEWDYRKQQLIKDHCNLLTVRAASSDSGELPPHLQATARRLKRQFQALRPQSQWVKQQEEGSELDLEAYLHFRGQRAAGYQVAEPKLYSSLEKRERDLACLLLADLSLSTDAWVGDHGRVIDIIRDSLYLFSECLQQTGDRFSICGFSSRYRNHVRYHLLKGFDQSYNRKVRQQIEAIKPGYYTRMGAAIRRSTELLSAQPQKQKLLLILTDGKPNDLDHYEGRYGIEDTRMAIIEARKAGLVPFCITIDQQAEDYLPYLFGRGNYTLIRRAAELPAKLPQLYAKLTS
ncbi:nitric oxide reductase activation protein NorD [Marinobacterium jannaschii]|uniref:nitric oxide reductase activation protein NorD n=1 Tax=Marinobacterium jannaschii TaxID=64970 RepID=UPI000483032B|nr:VWA domain-containing protein [Marinobacterium jannaschii]